MNRLYKNFYLIGAGGYGKQLSKMLKANKVINSSIFVDNKLKFNLKKFLKIKEVVYFSIFIGEPKKREYFFNILRKKKNFVYSTVVLSDSNLYTKKVGKGCIIEHYVLVTSGVKVGIGCLILTGSVIGHNSKIGDFCNIGVNVTISGNVKIGKKVSIGSQSFISNNVKICENVVIAPGSIVLKNITKPGIYNGNIFIKSK